MSDENQNNNTTNDQNAPVNQVIEEKTPSFISNFIQKLNSNVSDLWAKDKVFLIVFGVLILIVKFRDILIDILVKNGESIFKSAQQKDAALSQQEKQANDQANALVKEAEDLSKKQEEVSDNWYEKK